MKKTIQEQIEILEKLKEKDPNRELPVWGLTSCLFMSDIDVMIAHIKKGQATLLPCKDGSWGAKLTEKSINKAKELL